MSAVSYYLSRLRRMILVLVAAITVSGCSSWQGPITLDDGPPPYQPAPGVEDEETFQEDTSESDQLDVRLQASDETISQFSMDGTSYSFPEIPSWEPSTESTIDWRPPLYQPPMALRPEDHFYFTRPIPSGEVNWSHPFYRYGNTHFGESSIHTGVDMGAALGTPVLAAGDGEVIWVGYGIYRGSFDPEDPYGLAVAIRHDFGHLSQILFTVYGHLLTSNVYPGQRVMMGEEIGTVGNTGHSTGPHLHFEVRLGENRYFGTRNPELWMVPPEGWGVLAGRVLDTPGRTLKEYLVTISSLDTDRAWRVWTYAEGTVFSDELYRENFAISDLPAGPYEITIDYLGVRHQAQMYIYPGMTNFFVFNGRNGFTVEPELALRDFHPFQ